MVKPPPELQGKRNYYGEPGCCLTCEFSEPGCLCPECKCSICSMLAVNSAGERYCYLPYVSKELIVVVDKETEKAYLVTIRNDELFGWQIWIPKSIIREQKWFVVWENYIEQKKGIIKVPFLFLKEKLDDDLGYDE